MVTGRPRQQITNKIIRRRLYVLLLNLWVRSASCRPDSGVISSIVRLVKIMNDQIDSQEEPQKGKAINVHDWSMSCFIPVSMDYMSF